MRHLNSSRFLLPLLLLSHSVPGFASAPARAARMEKQLESLRRRLAIPGMSAGVVQDGGLTWSRGFGFADPARRIPATDRTPFRLASVTKTFTSMILLQLESEGLLSLSQSVTVDTAPTIVPIRSVLSHTSDDPVGGTYKYNHERFKSLGPVVESAAGKPLRRVVEERILLPFAMGDTAPGEDAGACPPFPDALDDYMAARDARVLMTAAPPYRLKKGLRAEPMRDAPGVLSAAGGMISTVRDLARFTARLNASALAPAFTPVKNSSGTDNPYGLGWFVQTVRGVKVAWHYGDVPDIASSLLIVVPEKGLAFILLADSDGLSAPFDDALSSGDVTASPFANDFLRLYVFEDAAGKPLPDPDWAARSGAFTSGIERAASPLYDYAGEAKAGAMLRDWRRRMTR